MRPVNCYTRFDQTKLLGAGSWWEFCKWDRVDTIGFLACSALSAAIVLLFVGLLAVMLLIVGAKILWVR